MKDLTPGDFACVARRLVIQGSVEGVGSEPDQPLHPDDPRCGRDPDAPNAHPEPSASSASTESIPSQKSWATKLIGMLQDELSFKTSSRQPMGFVVQDRGGNSNSAPEED